MGQAASIETGVIPLLWLGQNLEQHPVGVQLHELNQWQLSDGFVRTGFIVSDAVMQSVWTQVHWTDKALQDFPYLNLNFDLNQAAQLQFMAQRLQEGILALPLSDRWRAIWQAGLQQAGSVQILLTPYLWTSQTTINPALNLSNLLSLSPSLCSNAINNGAIGNGDGDNGAINNSAVDNSAVDQFWSRLKSLWASLFWAGNLYILQKLGLRTEDLHLSVLVQSLPEIQAAGWMQWSSEQVEIQAVQSLTPSVWEGQQCPESYRYCRLEPKAAWTVHSPAIASKQAFSTQEFKHISQQVLQPLLTVGAALEQQHLDLPRTVAWILWADKTHSKTTPNLEVLGWAPDLPWPTSAPQTSPGDNCLGKGMPAAPGDLVAPVVVVENFQQLSPIALRGRILVTRSLEPIHLAWLQEAAGLICESGGILSHGAIMAREFGRPAIVGIEGILKTLRTGQWVMLNGTLGEIYAQPNQSNQWDNSAPEAPLIQSFASAKPSAIEFSAAYKTNKQHKVQPAASVTQSAVVHPSRITPTTPVFVNLSQPTLLPRVQELAVDGLGLVRGEWLLLDQLRQANTAPNTASNMASNTAPNTIPNMPPWLQGSRRTQIKRKLRGDLEQMSYALMPYPVYYRAVDLYATDWRRVFAATKSFAEAPPPAENNPAIGLRGALRHLYDDQLLALELEVLQELVADGIDNLRFILPFVRSPQEVRYCVQKMQALDLDQHLPLWMMAEVPSVLFSLDAYKRAGIQGITIGLNDLTQLLLGIDRDHPAFESILAQQSTTVMEAIAQLVKRAAELELPSILCGSLDHASEEWLERLLRFGLTGFSVDLGAVENMRRAIVQAEQSIQSAQSSASNSDTPEALR